MLDITLCEPQRHEALTVFPLAGADPVDLACDLLTDALSAGTLRITEVGAGTVPRLLATNKGEVDVLVLDGEQLVGARQNRMTNRSILLPAGSETEIPVSCMEQGRWRVQSDAFAPTRSHSPSGVRRRAREAEAARAAAGDVATPDSLALSQGEVWREIAAYSTDLGNVSETGALDGVYARREEDLETWAAAFPAVPGQVGLLAFVGGEPIGMDVIGSQRLYGLLHGRLLHGYIVDAWRGGRTEAPTEVRGRMAAQHFLHRVREAWRTEAPTVGRGRYRVLTGAVVGGELDADGRLVHLCAFPSRRGPERGGGGGGIAPPSRRRRPEV